MMDKQRVVRLVRRAFPNAFLPRMGDRGIQERGHRQYVGGAWEKMSALQFEFLLSQGLKPEHYLLDVACGSLRLGIRAVPYLDAGHYLGIEKEAGLVKAGLEHEIGPEIAAEKKPQIVISHAFEFEQLGQVADVAIAQSLFTHIPPRMIRQCLENLRPFLADNGAFYATFFESDRPVRNSWRPHDHGQHRYTREQMKSLGETCGYSFEYIGDWNHPAGQKMCVFRKGSSAAP